MSIVVHRSRSRSRSRSPERKHRSRSRSRDYRSRSRSEDRYRSRRDSSYSRSKSRSHSRSRRYRSRSRSRSRGVDPVEERFIRMVARKVKEQGQEFEDVLRQREEGKSKFAFLWDSKVYYHIFPKVISSNTVVRPLKIDITDPLCSRARD